MTENLPAKPSAKQEKALAGLGIDVANLPTSTSYDQILEGRGPVFPFNRLSVNDSRFSLLRPEDGGEAALKSKKLGGLTVIPIYAAEEVNRRYYKGAYEKGKEAGPVCYSDDDVTPHASAPEPQARTCKGCPMNVQGSGEGGAGRACKFVRPMVVVPLLKGTPVKDLASVWVMNAVTLFGTKSEEEDAEMGDASMYGGNEYIDMIADAGVPLSSIVCELLFDTDASGPGSAYKILVHPKGGITADQVKALDEGDRLEVERMVHPDIRVNTGEISIEDSDSGEAGALPADDEEPDLDEEEIVEEEPEQPRPASKKKAAAKKKSSAKKKAAAKAKPVVEPSGGNADEELELDDDITSELDDSDDDLGSLDDDDEVPDDDFDLE